MVMMTVWRLGDGAYGVSIRDEVMDVTGKHWSIGAIYDVLDRLDREGYISRTMGESMKERGGRRKQMVKITDKGHEALRELNRIHSRLWKDLSETSD